MDCRKLDKMELTEEQKKLGLLQAWWDNQEGCKRDIEYSREHPLSPEELQEQINNSKAALQNQASLKK